MCLNLVIFQVERRIDKNKPISPSEIGKPLASRYIDDDKITEENLTLICPKCPAILLTAVGNSLTIRHAINMADNHTRQTKHNAIVVHRTEVVYESNKNWTRYSHSGNRINKTN